MAKITITQALQKTIEATKKYVDNKLAGLQIVQITQTEYDALTTKDPNTLYLIVE